MKAEFIETANQIKIKDFPYFLYSEAPFFKILNILKDDFYIAIRTSKKNEGEEGKEIEDESKNSKEDDIKFVDLTFTAKEKLNKDEAEELFKEIMNSLISFEKGSSLLNLEPNQEVECN